MDRQENNSEVSKGRQSFLCRFIGHSTVDTHTWAMQEKKPPGVFFFLSENRPEVV